MNPTRVRWLLAALILTGLCFRAATQSFSHDEVLSYIKVRDDGWSFLVAAGSVNSHLLNLVGMKLALETFGNSPVALRLPVLLAGLGYLLLLLNLARRELGGGWLATLAFAVLATNPYFLDFFCCARGYGLALTFMLAALLATSRLLLREKTTWQYLGLSGLFLAAYAGSLTVAYCVLALNLLILVAQIPGLTSDNWRPRILKLGLGLVLPQLVGVYFLTKPFWLMLGKQSFYYGATDWTESIGRLLPLSLAHIDREDFVDEPLLPTLDLVAPTIPYLLAGLALIHLWAYWRGVRSRSGRPVLTMAFVVAVTGILGVGLHSFSHLVVGQPLPTARTALTLALLVLLAFGLLPFAISAKRKSLVLLPVLAALPLVLLLVVQARFLLTDHYAEWRWDAGAERIFKELEGQRVEARGLKILTVPFLHGPSLAYLREQRQADWIELIDQELNPEVRYDFIVIAKTAAQLPEVAQFIDEVIYRDELSGVWLVRPISN